MKTMNYVLFFALTSICMSDPNIVNELTMEDFNDFIKSTANELTMEDFNDFIKARELSN
jgi:hypothetical protein